MPIIDQTSFSSGIVSPDIAARLDFTARSSGVSDGLNGIVHPQGGISNRTGFEFVREFASGAGFSVGSIVPYVADRAAGLVYILVFPKSLNHFYAFRAGGLVHVESWSTIKLFAIPSEVASPSNPTGLSDASVVVFGVDHLDPTPRVDVGDSIVFPDNPSSYLSAASFFIGSTFTGSAVDIEPSYTTPITVSGVTLYRLLDSGGREVQLGDLDGYTDNPPARVASAVRFSHPTITTPSATSGRFSYSQDNDLLYLTHPDFPPCRVGRRRDGSWEFGAVNFNSYVPTPIQVNASPRGASGSDTSSVWYKVTAISNTSGRESVASSSAQVATSSLGLVGAYNEVTWAAGSLSGDLLSEVTRWADFYASGVAPGADIVYHIFRSDNEEGPYGFIGESVATNFVFHDKNYAPNMAHSYTEFRNPFADDAGGNPKCVTMHEQRLVHASLAYDAQRTHFSRTADVEDFSKSLPIKATDAIDVRIRSTQRVVINSMVSLPSVLYMFSDSGIYSITGGADGGPLTPSTVNVSRPFSWGGSEVLPLVIGSDVLFVTSDGGVRELGVNARSGRLDSEDRSILAYHLFSGHRVVSWCHVQTPHSMVWAALEDGSVLSFTYLVEHEVYAWMRHDVSGKVVSLVSVPEDSGDVVYALVTRERDGQTITVLERMRPRSYTGSGDVFLDSCLSYSGSPVSVVYGLEHLEGRTVSASADGMLIENLVVKDGEISLAFPASEITVGLPYTSRVVSVSFSEKLTRLDTSSERFVLSLVKLHLLFRSSKGVSYGIEGSPVFDIVQRTGEPMGQGVALFSGWREVIVPANAGFGVSFVVEQRRPFPFTLLSVGWDVKGPG